MDLKPTCMPSGSLAVRKAIKASSVWGSGYEPELAFDDDDTTRWGAASGTRSGWLEVDLGTDRTFSRALINQEGWNRISELELQSWNGDSWTTFYASPDGERLEGKLNLEFQPVTARRVRLNIPKSTDVITIWEVQLFQK
jgi:alpha-L-fucosidase